jgi:hypothetical protein
MSFIGYITSYPVHIVAICLFCLFYLMSTVFYDKGYRSYSAFYFLMFLLFSLFDWSLISKNSKIYYVKNLSVFSVLSNHLLLMFIITISFVSIHIMTNFLIRQRVAVITKNSKNELNSLTERLYSLSSEKIIDLHRKYYDENCTLIKEISLLKREINESLHSSKEVNKKLYDVNKLITDFNKQQGSNVELLKTSTEYNLQLVINKIADMINYTSEIMSNNIQSTSNAIVRAEIESKNIPNELPEAIIESTKQEKSDDAVFDYISGSDSFMENNTIPVNQLFSKDRKKKNKDKKKYDGTNNLVEVVKNSGQERDKLYSTLKDLLQIK